jgi:hypothetical protein
MNLEEGGSGRARRRQAVAEHEVKSRGNNCSKLHVFGQKKISSKLQPCKKPVMFFLGSRQYNIRQE